MVQARHRPDDPLPELGPTRVFEAIKALPSHPRVRELRFRNDTGHWNEDPNYPDGVYWGPGTTDAGEDWSLDLWFIHEHSRQVDLEHVLVLPPRLTPRDPPRDPSDQGRLPRTALVQQPRDHDGGAHHDVRTPAEYRAHIEGAASRGQLREHAEARPLARDLVELGVAAAELVAAALVARSDLDLAHRQRRAGGADAAEALSPSLRCPQQVEVDLDPVDLLHAADVGVTPRLVRVDERARALDARPGVHDLVAVHLAATTLDLVLRAERKLGRCRRGCSTPGLCALPGRSARLDIYSIFRQRARRVSSAAMVRRILFASVALAPLVILIHYVFHPTETLEFVLAAAALIPLAWLIGEATEHAAEHTGPGIGGFLNATFGNAPELIIALFAVNAMEFEVVRGSLTGSVVGNLLLVLGFSLLFGGRGEIDKPSSFLSLGLVAVTTLLLLITVHPELGRRPGARLARRPLDPGLDRAAGGLRGVDVVLAPPPRGVAHASDAEIKGWSLRLALVVLGLATVVTALVAEILVGSINTFADGLRHQRVLPRRGRDRDRRERGRARRRSRGRRAGKIKLATEIALSSSAQVAVFLIPAVALLALLIEPLALASDRWRSSRSACRSWSRRSCSRTDARAGSRV